MMQRPHARVIKTHHEKNLEAMENALLARAGFQKHDYKNPFNSASLIEMGRTILEHNRQLPREGSRMDLAGAILSSAANHNSGDFPNLLKNVANKAMLIGWNEAEEHFDKWTRKGSLPNFREEHRVALNAFPSLREVPEGAEYKHVTIGDVGEKIQLATFGELFAITRNSLINDDQRAFTRLPQDMGRAAKATIGELVNAIMIDGQTMTETGKTLFHEDHGNLSDVPFGEAGLIQATGDLRRQRDPSGNARLNIRPRYLIVPAALEFEARKWMASTVTPGKTNDEQNVFAGLAEVIADARFDGASPTAWYMVADHRVIDTIEVAYLDGNDQPFIEEQPGWGVDGIEYKVRIDAGVRALSYRGMWKSTGDAA
jgi:hypothetical protein